MDLAAHLTAPVKLVIWDLDETFWQGTLSEEGIQPVQAHIDMLRVLVDRGIMCSVCSKNDLAAAQTALEALGVWDLFVFPHIDWTPKGQAVAGMLTAMGLRPENALFLDDNHLNLEEVKFTNPGIMTVDATQFTVTDLLDLPQLQGKDDRDRTRLEQYRVMQTKQGLQAETGLSNIDFLRQSGIRIKVITDIENHMDRVLEMLNRTNQLNYTKVRANTPEEKTEFDALLKIAGMHAGLIHVQDRYGDYGIVGFFCIRTRFTGTTVHHLAFSCRTLNMGVEQWVWEYLGKPQFEAKGPVANPIQTFDAIDWITEVTDFTTDTVPQVQKHISLVGGCDLLNVSFYCGTKRDEFVNKQDDQGMIVRYDDVGFFLNPREVELRNTKALKMFVGYEFAELEALDKSLATADLILLSLYFSVPVDNLWTFGGREFGGKYWATIPPARMKRLMQNPETATRFAKEMHHRKLPLPKRLDLTRQCYAYAARLRQTQAPLFILGAATEHGEMAARNIDTLTAFNAMCREFCAATPNTHFIDVDRLLVAEEFVDSIHYTRTGYFKIAQFVNDRSDAIRAGQQRAAE
jgi:FkbH-like protein